MLDGIAVPVTVDAGGCIEDGTLYSLHPAFITRLGPCCYVVAVHRAMDDYTTLYFANERGSVSKFGGARRAEALTVVKRVSGLRDDAQALARLGQGYLRVSAIVASGAQAIGQEQALTWYKANIKPEAPESAQAYAEQCWGAFAAGHLIATGVVHLPLVPEPISNLDEDKPLLSAGARLPKARASRARAKAVLPAAVEAGAAAMQNLARARASCSNLL